jgi:hypothetical protein
MTARNVVPMRPVSASDRLEQLARRPQAPRPELLRHLAERLRSLEALESLEREHVQLELREVA